MPYNKTEEALRGEWKKFCTTDNFSAPPYEHEIISDWWLSLRQKELQELREKTEGMRKPVEEKYFESWKNYKIVGNECYNKALDDLLAQLKQ